jgi:predicted alpha/beta hydrolase family esterase
MFSERFEPGKIEKVVILHGYAGNTDDHWQTWLSKECIAKGLNVQYPNLPESMNPSLEKWIQALKDEHILFDSKTAVVCHSLGCALALQYLKEINIKKLGLLILAAPTTRTKLNGIGLSFLEHFYDGIDIENISPKILKTELYYSSNDPYVDENDAKVLGFHLRASLHLINMGGHLNVASGHTTFPEVLNNIISPNLFPLQSHQMASP